MEDLYKDDPNSWLWRTKFSKTIYHRPIPSQIPIISIAELKLGSSAMSTLKSNPSAGFTDHAVAGSSETKTIKAAPASKKKTLSGMLKKVKETVRSRFVGAASREGQRAKTVNSSSRPKKESRWMQKYFDRGERQVSALVKSSEFPGSV